jgi:hypothetical protein
MDGKESLPLPPGYKVLSSVAVNTVLTSVLTITSVVSQKQRDWTHDGYLPWRFEIIGLVYVKLWVDRWLGVGDFPTDVVSGVDEQELCLCQTRDEILR